MVYSFLFISVRTYLDYCDIYTIHPLLISLNNNYRKYKNACLVITGAITGPSWEHC